MKKSLLLVIFVLGSVSCGGESYRRTHTPELYPIPVRVGFDAFWSGYMDREGVVQWEPRYEIAGDFHCERAIIQDSQRHWAIIDLNGRRVAELGNPPKDGFHVDFSDDRAFVWLGGRLTLINPSGDPVSDLSVEDARAFVGGVAAACKGGRWGAVDIDGKWLIGPTYLECVVGESGIMSFRNSDGWGVRNAFTGEILAQALMLERLWRCSDGLIPAKRDGRWGYIDVKGTWRIFPIYLKAKVFSAGLAAVQNSESEWLYIDTNGNPFNADRFVEASSVENGYALAFEAPYSMICMDSRLKVVGRATVPATAGEVLPGEVVRITEGVVGGAYYTVQGKLIRRFAYY